MDDLQLAALLREAEQQAPDAGELHRLTVLYRHRGPAPQGVTEWLAGLLRGGTAAAVAVRSVVEPQLYEYQAGPYRILLEARPRAGHARVDVHGQLFVDGELPGGGSVLLSCGHGQELMAELDEHGEFDLRQVPCGTCRASWHLGETRVVVPELELASGGGG